MDTYGSRAWRSAASPCTTRARRSSRRRARWPPTSSSAREDDLEFATAATSPSGAPTSRSNIKALAFAAWTRPRPARRHGAGPHGDPHLRPAELLLAERRPRLRGRGGHGDRVSVDIQRYIAVDDCGVRINPIVVEGQVHGGVAQGIAEALFEEARYDEEGNLLHGTMTTYMVPGPPELPTLRAASHRHPQPHEPAGRQGHRGGRHDRRAARGRQRGRRRPLAPGRHATSSGRRRPRGSGRRSRRRGHDPDRLRLRGRRVGRPRPRAAAHEGGRQAARRRPQPPAADEAAPRPAGHAGRHRPAVGPARGEGRGRPPGDRGAARATTTSTTTRSPRSTAR